MNKPIEIEIPVWWRPGNGMMYRRDCLPPTHEEHTYNYIKRVYGVNPEDYGVQHPLTKKYKGVTRSELIAKIESLETL